MAQRILVIEDESTIQAVIRRILTNAGYKITWASTGQAAINLLKTIFPDLILLDLVLPDISGVKICAEVRRNALTRAIPILILTGCNTEGLAAQCLNAGADDFLHKPFDAQELQARIQAILRRPRLYESSEGTIDGGSLRILIGSRDIYFHGHKLPALTPKEFNLMKALVLHSPVVLSKGELARLAWSEPSELLHPRTLDVHIRRIRLKFGPTVAQGLKTVPAIGYQWVEPAPMRNEN